MKDAIEWECIWRAGDRQESSREVYFRVGNVRKELSWLLVVQFLEQSNVQLSRNSVEGEGQ